MINLKYYRGERYNKEINNINYKRGFTLIELLITVAIIGIIVAIAIPNMMNAWDKARQKRSMADLRAWGLALNSYFVDHNFFPYGSPGEITPDFYLYKIISGMKELTPPPYRDGWNNSFYYFPGGDSLQLSQIYTIASFGKGNAMDATPLPNFKCFQCDISFKGNRFYTKPNGPQIDSPTQSCDPSLCR